MNTIYDNTFVLGQTSATNLQAGPGISITQPAEGTVRIANDETVLWETTNSTPASQVTLSENAANFEQIRILISPEGTYNGYSTYVIINCAANDTNRTWDLVVGNGGTNAWISIIRCHISSDGLTLDTDYKKAISFGAYTSTATTLTATSTANPTTILKVVGINRKEV